MDSTDPTTLLLNLQTQLTALQSQFNFHLGPNPGASSLNIPHPQDLLTVTAAATYQTLALATTAAALAAQSGRYM